MRRLHVPDAAITGQPSNGRVGYDDYYIDGARIHFSKGRWQTHQFAGNAPGCPGDQKNGSGPGGVNDVVSGRDYLTLQRLSVLAERVKLTKGDTDVVDGVTCQIWEASKIISVSHASPVFCRYERQPASPCPCECSRHRHPNPLLGLE